MLSKGISDHHQMIKNIFPLLLLFILVSPISRTQQKNGETFPLHNFKTLVTLSSQSSKILADFQGKDKMDTQRNESSPRALIRNELDNNRINNLKINDGIDIKEMKHLSRDVSTSLKDSKNLWSEIDEKALMLPQKSSRAFLMSTDIIDVSRVVATLFVHSVRLCKLCYTPSSSSKSSERFKESLVGALEISDESYPNSGHLAIDKVITLPSLPTIWVEAFNGEESKILKMMIPSNGMNG